MALAPTPGIFLANSGVLPAYASSVLPYPAFVKWYEEIHIPDWMGAKPGAITAAWRYESADPTRATPFLAAYKYPDVSAQSAPEFAAVSLSHPSLPEGGPISKFITISIQAGGHIETWRSGSTGDERGPLLVTETLTPAPSLSTEQFHEWYRTTYITELSMMDGWRRTSRFDTGARGGGWLTLHEFEERAFEANTTKIAGLLGTSKETKDVERAARKVDLALWKLVRVYGDKTAAWGLPGEDKIL